MQRETDLCIYSTSGERKAIITFPLCITEMGILTKVRDIMIVLNIYTHL